MQSGLFRLSPRSVLGMSAGRTFGFGWALPTSLPQPNPQVRPDYTLKPRLPPIRVGTPPRSRLTPARWGYRVQLLMKVFLSTHDTWSVVPLPTPESCPKLSKLMVPTSRSTQLLGLDFHGLVVRNRLCWCSPPGSPVFQTIESTIRAWPDAPGELVCGAKGRRSTVAPLRIISDATGVTVLFVPESPGPGELCQAEADTLGPR